MVSLSRNKLVELLAKATKVCGVASIKIGVKDERTSSI